MGDADVVCHELQISLTKQKYCGVLLAGSWINNKRGAVHRAVDWQPIRTDRWPLARFQRIETPKKMLPSRRLDFG